MNKISISLLLLTSIAPQPAMATGNSDSPNILWLTFDDASDCFLGCCGDKWSAAPNIDSLAKSGIIFTNAYSNASRRSPARSTLITGSYATTYAMELHRGRVATSKGIFYPQYLRDPGYFCTNNIKTDYNTTANHKETWDACGNKATYNSPKREKTNHFLQYLTLG